MGGKRTVAAGEGRRPSARTTGSWPRWATAFLLLLAGFLCGLLIPSMIYLNHRVVSEFEGRKWDLPSRVFARPLDLYAGAPLTMADLELELRLSGYRRSHEAERPGQYSVDGSRVEIHRRAFRFHDGAESAQRILVRIAGASVAEVRDARAGAAIPLARLDPAEIASIYPLAKEDRTLIDLEHAPRLLVTGLQAVEDRQFKHHPGVDVRGVTRAALANLMAGRTVQGGSTLTQQLVKNFFLTQERTLARKLTEAAMAVLLDAHYDKGEILEAYINEVFLGQQGAYAIHGFGRASVYYFDQPLERLEPHQIALLIGLVRGPSYYNPRRHPERAKQRRDQVLMTFAETGLLTDEEARTALALDLGVTLNPRSGSRYPAFIGLVRRQLSEAYKDEELRSEGLRIFTTLSPSEQEKAQSAVSQGLHHLAERGLPKQLQGALVLADPSSGEVRALVGDRDPATLGFNRAIEARRQIGSIIKPLVYLLALERTDYNLLTRIRDDPVTVRQPGARSWKPTNYDGLSHGEVSLLEALTHSYNQATVRLGLQVGVKELLSRLRQFGVATDAQPVPSVFLGAVELTPLEVTQIYQSLAAGGFTVPLRSVLAVQTAEGDELIRYPLRLQPQPRREAIGVLNYALTQVVEHGTAAALPGLLGKPVVVAGKTGTTNDRRDSWFAGYTRDRVAVAWVGRDDNRSAGVTGANAAMRIWAELFSRLPLDSVDLHMPEGASWLWVDATSGRLSAEHCRDATRVPFVAGSEPREVSACAASASDPGPESIWHRLLDRLGNRRN